MIHINHKILFVIHGRYNFQSIFHEKFNYICFEIEKNELLIWDRTWNEHKRVIAGKLLDPFGHGEGWRSWRNLDIWNVFFKCSALPLCLYSYSISKDISIHTVSAYFISFFRYELFTLGKVLFSFLRQKISSDKIAGGARAP